MSDDIPMIATAQPVHPLLARRFSARRFDADAPLAESDLIGMLEAARLAPSAYNYQPWRFRVVRRATLIFSELFAGLAEENLDWAGDAQAFVIGIAELRGADGSPRPWALYDLGQATAHLTLEATARGFSVCQMDGTDPLVLRRFGGDDPRFVPQLVSAIGRPIGWRPLTGQTTRWRSPLAEIVFSDGPLG